MENIYVFNEWLFRKLPNFIGMGKEKISLSIGKKRTWLGDIVNGGIYGIDVVALIDICNKHHIPISYFFCKPEETGVYKEFKGEYKPSRLKVDALIRLFAGRELSPAHLSDRALKQLLAGNKATIGSPRGNWFTVENNHLKARELANLCNKLCLDINEIIDDPMGMLHSLYTKNQFRQRCAEVCREYDRENKERRSYTIRKKREELTDKNRRLEAQIDQLEARNRQLEEELRLLRQELKPTLSIAASPDMGYESGKK